MSSWSAHLRKDSLEPSFHRTAWWETGHVLCESAIHQRVYPRNLLPRINLDKGLLALGQLREGCHGGIGTNDVPCTTGPKTLFRTTCLVSQPFQHPTRKGPSYDKRQEKASSFPSPHVPPIGRKSPGLSFCSERPMIGAHIASMLCHPLASANGLSTCVPKSTLGHTGGWMRCWRNH